MTTLDREKFNNWWVTVEDRFGGVKANALYVWQARKPEIDALKAEMERLRKDAERYRFLRNLGAPELCACIKGWPSYIGDTPNNAGQKLDAAIDAAMADKGE